MKNKLCLLLILLSASKVNYAQTDGNDMFSIKAEGNLLTFTALKCNTLAIEGTIGTTRIDFDTAFTLRGSVSFTIAPSLAGKHLRFRTHTKCGNNSNSRWVGFTLTAANALPVKVLHFSAHKNNSAVQVFYHVEVSEGDAFEIQRSSDGRKWQQLLFVSSSTANPYTGVRSLLDFATTEKNYYRMVIYEGFTIKYSDILYVPMPADTTDVTVFTTAGVPLATIKKVQLAAYLATLPKGFYAIPGKIKTNF